MRFAAHQLLDLTPGESMPTIQEAMSEAMAATRSSAPMTKERAQAEATVRELEDLIRWLELIDQRRAQK